jgi:hypothetical protein
MVFYKSTFNDGRQGLEVQRGEATGHEDQLVLNVKSDSLSVVSDG